MYNIIYPSRLHAFSGPLTLALPDKAGVALSDKVGVALSLSLNIKGWMTRQIFLADQNQHVSKPTSVE